MSDVDHGALLLFYLNQSDIFMKSRTKAIFCIKTRTQVKFPLKEIKSSQVDQVTDLKYQTLKESYQLRK